MISIIIPCYNTLQFLEVNLERVIDFATFCRGEIIIIDDGSEQDIQGFIKHKNNAALIYHKQKNKGVASARNKGICLAKYETLLFLDSDDTLDFELLKSKTHELLCNDFSYWGAKKIFPNGADKLYPTKKKDSVFELLRSLLQREQQIFMGGFSVSKKIAETVLFDIKYKYGEDLKFIFESIVKSKTIFMIDAPLLNYVQHAASAINNFNDQRFDSLHAISSINFGIFSEELNDSIEYLLKKDRIVILRTLSISKPLKEIINYSRHNVDMKEVVKQHFGGGAAAVVRMLIYIISYKFYVFMRDNCKNKISLIKGSKV
ncbi:glycosyltransferase [Citrobacter sp. NCU1]|uniref:glycosyltransferase n=1 Tax=Citrobacter sp. NCU1 TaxID=2026683 RepID=UPI0013910929